MDKALRRLLFGMAISFVASTTASAAAGARGSTSGMPPTVVQNTCSWNHPGVNPFMGDVVAAVDRYRDIPVEVRARLKARMAKREYDDIVSIRRDNITGRAGYDYGSTISDMHFGTNSVCRSVTRDAWSTTMQERGLVYCESGSCILVPTVCRNVSRLTRKGVANESLKATGPAAAEAAVPEIGWFGPTGAGVLAADEALTPDGLSIPVGGSPTFASTAFGPADVVAMAEAGRASNPLRFDIGAGAPPMDGSIASAIAKGPASAIAAAEAPVAPIPEPETWCLMLAGLTLLAAANRSRGRSVRASKRAPTRS